MICENKQLFDRKSAEKTLEKALKTNYFYTGREWPYKNVRPRIIAEPLLAEAGADAAEIGDLTDYKFFCFHGKPEICLVVSDRRGAECIDFFDMDWNLLDLHVREVDHVFPGKKRLDKPACLEKMIRAAGRLSEGFPFLRVDFYQVGGRMYLGELTFYDASGFRRLEPEYWNRKLGSMIRTDETKGGNK